MLSSILLIHKFHYPHTFTKNKIRCAYDYYHVIKHEPQHIKVHILFESSTLHSSRTLQSFSCVHENKLIKIHELEQSASHIDYSQDEYQNDTCYASDIYWESNNLIHNYVRELTIHKDKDIDIINAHLFSEADKSKMYHIEIRYPFILPHIMIPSHE